MRIGVFGLKSLLRDFKKRNPQHYLVLSRINGSAIESLFSQIKYATAGKLSSVNYGFSRRAVIISSNVQSSHAQNENYRGDRLDIV